MSLDLVYYGNETLKTVALEVKNIDDNIKKLIDEMYKVMALEKGIGLAAPQVNISKRVIVLDIDGDVNTRFALINPVITEFSQEVAPYEEGCLSVPRITADIVRPVRVTVSGLDVDGNKVTIEADELLARALQHEVDHLNGKLFIDHLEDYERNELRKELKKIRRMNK